MFALLVLATAVAAGALLFNITVLPTLPQLSWSALNVGQNLSDTARQVYWSPSAGNPYYVNFTSLQVSLREDNTVPRMSVTAYCTDMYFWGRFSDWNSTNEEP
jgi:hypothetical protein